MKRNNIFIFQWAVWLCITLISCSGVEEDMPTAGIVNGSNSDTRAELIEYTINMETAGTLDSLVEAGGYADAQKLIITGYFDDNDFKYVAESMPTVEVLDLSGAQYPLWILRGIYIPTIKEISLPWNLTAIASGVFKNVTNLISIHLPEKGLRIYDSAFMGCTSLTSIYIPGGIGDVNESLFQGCSSLTSVHLPSVSIIKKNAFRGCSSLTDINMPEDLTSIEESAFRDCSSLTSITIPEGVTSIGEYAFSGCSSLTSVTLPKSLTNIGRNAFADCSSLTSIDIPENVEKIGIYAFNNCKSLTDVHISDGVTKIEDLAFNRCTSLLSISIPGSVTSIGGSAFNYCSSLKNVDFSEGLTSIGKYAFRDCSSLTKIDLPESVTSIGESAFSGCSSLTEINLPDSLTSIKHNTFEGCTSLTSIHIPESVTDYGGAFYGCSSLTSINIPEGVTWIGGFEGCSSLSNIHIPDSVTTIYDYAFRNCSSLTSINIPESVTTIKSTSFEGCTALRIIEWNTPCSINDAFYDLTGKLIIYEGENVTSGEGHIITSAKKVIYTKKFTTESDVWYTISLPFKPTQITHENKGTLAPFDSNIEGAKNFWLRELTLDGYQDVTEIEASHPYIIAMPTNDRYSSEFKLDGIVSFSAENVALNWEPVAAEGPTYSMYPNYETVKKSMDVYALNSSYWIDGFDYGRLFVRGAMNIEPLQAYVKLNDGAATMRSVLPMADGKRTAVRGASSSNDASSRGAYGHQKPRKEDM